MLNPQAIPLALYIHLPWCVKKCPYCDFNSHHLRGDLPEQGYINALLADLNYIRQHADDKRQFSSLFFGGGTPSLFSPQAIGQVIDAAASTFGLTQDCEITLEANPGASEHGQFVDYKAAGVTRISLGVQSLNDDSLKRLGRVHDAQTALHAVDAVQAAGFDSMNCDLMFGLPSQTTAMAAADVAGIIERAPAHISYYQLTYEVGTPFYFQRPKRLDDDTIVDIFEASSQQLTQAGFEQYEVSAWSQPDFACRHNTNYWSFGDYLAIGAGAHAKLTNAQGEVKRTTRQPGPNAYTRAAGTADAVIEQRTLSADDLRFEFLLNGLRLRQGINRQHYEQRTGLDWTELQDSLQWAKKAGLLAIDALGLRASDKGWYYLDDILSAVLPESS